MIGTGLDRLLAEPAALAGRRYGLLAHAAAVSVDLRPAHLALAEAGTAPTVLFGPEHGYYGVEQDMIAAEDARDPVSGVPIVSLYGDQASSLRPRPDAFAGLELLVIDLQDVGARYYTYAATAVWAAETAAEAGLEIWLLDRPNPLGGELIEGPLRRPGFESFVGAFELPVRHGLTLGELVLLEARRRGFADALRIWELGGWRRSMLWPETGRPWLNPSPNLPTWTGALLYPGLCLLEGTELSEGRGTTRPFELVGAPGIPSQRLAERLERAGLTGVRWIPTLFRPQYQKHHGELCAGVQVVVSDAGRLAPFRCGVELLAALREVAPESFSWRQAPYEFVSDRPAIDLLAGGPKLRQGLETGEGLEEWIALWRAEEEGFREARREALLYPE